MLIEKKEKKLLNQKNIHEIRHESLIASSRLAFPTIFLKLISNSTHTTRVDTCTHSLQRGTTFRHGRIP